MCQNLSGINEKLTEFVKTDGISLNAEIILSGNDTNDINVFIHQENPTDSIEPNCDNQISNSEKQLIQNIQTKIYSLARINELKRINNEIHTNLIETIFIPMATYSQQAINDITSILEKKEQLQISLMKKLDMEKCMNQETFEIPSETTDNNDQELEFDKQIKRESEIEDQRVAHLATQSFSSILLLLIKSVEKHDPSIIDQVLTLATQLYENLPMKYLSSRNKQNNFLFQSLIVLTNYIHQLPSSDDKIFKEKIIKILLSFAIANGSFKDILPLLNQLIFNNTDVLNVRNLFIQLNNGLSMAIKRLEYEQLQSVIEQMNEEDSDSDSESNHDQNYAIKSKQMIDALTSTPLTYLTSTGIFPNTELIKLDDQQLTGPLISSIVLTHIDFGNEVNADKQFQSSLMNSSISFEFDPNTFKQLVHMIEQLILKQDITSINLHILTILLKLLTTHLKFLSAIKQEFLPTTMNRKSNKDIDLMTFITDDDLQKLFDILSRLILNPEKTFEVSQTILNAFIYIINQKFSTFIDKLSFYHQFIIENKCSLLIKEFFIEFNKPLTLLNWIEILCNNNDVGFTILYSFIDICLNPSNDLNEEYIKQIEQILKSFRQLLFIRLIPEVRIKKILDGPNDNTDIVPNTPLSVVSVVNKLFTYILTKYINKIPLKKDLFNSILIDLYLMTDTERLFHFATIQPIFIHILPLLAEYILGEDGIRTDLCWLIGKIIHILINGFQQDTLENKLINKLKLSLFAGGCETNESLSNLLESNLATYCQFQGINQDGKSSSDYEFLMSIYNNIDQGAQLISKLKIHSKNKQHLLQKSIEQQADDACAAVYAVYIKYFRRINLAQYELNRTNNRKPHKKLVSLFQHANYVYILFATTKGQGGDCNQLYNQIKNNALFLLSSIKESHFIPIIEIDQTLSETTQQSKPTSSLWKKEKHNSFRLIHNVFKASSQLKKMISASKRFIEQKQDNEYVLHQMIDEFIYKTILSSQHFQSEEIIQCMNRQYERAITRLITFRFISTLINKLLQIKTQQQVLTVISLALPYLRGVTLEWTYLENIQTVNEDLKEEIGNSYYSIIQTILSLQSDSIQTVFHLLNFSYTQIDISRLYHHQFVEILFKTFVSFTEQSNYTISLYTKFLGYNWFRLYLLKLCENIEFEHEQGEFVFNKLILNELKQWKQISNQTINTNNSLKNTTIAWFIQAVTTDLKLDIELYTNQFLILLLRCLHSYTNVRHYCASIDYIEELLYIYRNSQNNITILLSLKILRHLIPLISEDIDEASKTIITNFFEEILYSIGDSFTSNKLTPEMTSELIFIYRTIMSVTSLWQIMATQMIFHTILSYSNLKLLENISTKQMNYLVSSLCILGGYIYPYCLSSIVQVYSNDEINNETQLAVIIDIDKNALNSDSTDALPYFIQYSQTNKIQQVTANKLRIEIDVSPPNLLLLPNINETISQFFDVLISFIQIDTSITESLFLLQVKRRSIAALYRLLNNKNLIDIFLQKPYASMMAKLSISDLLSKTNRQPIDLRLLNKQHLEQYSLSLDRCKQSKEIIHDKNNMNKENSSLIHWNDQLINQDHLTEELLSTVLSQDYQWKSNASKKDIQLFKRGRIGNDHIDIVPMPSTITNTWFLEESGLHHRFPGRTYLISESNEQSMATFIIDNLRLSEGNWYYCIRLLEGTNVQIGWATIGFTPSNTIGVGNDKYSWSYDGSRNKLCHEQQYQYLTEDIHWGINDICGCGIEISDNHIRINYWLNGHFFGTAFEHQSSIGITTTNCNMLPNGYGATYFPSITLKANNFSITSCEFIFNPDDMMECPLPKGYKPLLLPTLVNVEYGFVPYPYNAYLIGDNIQDYIEIKRNIKTNTFLRDFVNDDHLENLFTFDNHQLILTKESDGFPLLIDNAESLTISFDFEILTDIESADISLLTVAKPNVFSIRIPSNKITKPTRIAIVFHSNTQQTTVYINNEYHLLENPLITKYHLHILPNISVGIKNLGIWKYSLSQEHIRRLFIYGLSYISFDYHRLKNHRKQMNTLTFNKNQSYFSNELLIPFHQPFDENKYEKLKYQIDNDESNYFQCIKGTNQSTIELFGNQTYLILAKSIDSYVEYTLILDILIRNYPKINEQITLITLNNSQLELFITDHGYLYLSIGIQNESILKLNEYIRLLISIDKTSIKIYANGLLELDVNIDNTQWMSKDKRIDLFHEKDLLKNTMDENTLRIECKSISYLNKTMDVIDEKLKSSNYSLDTFLVPSFSILAASLLLIGYDQTLIKSILEQNLTTNFQCIDTLLREATNSEEKPRKKEDILSKLTPLIDQDKLKQLIDFSPLNTDETIINLTEIIFTHRNNLQTSYSIDENISCDKKWFYQSIRHLNITDSLIDWIRDKSLAPNGVDVNYPLLDLTQPVQDQTLLIENQHKIIAKSIQYSHEQITHREYYQSRIACEYELISIYAHYTILNLLRIWSNNASDLFPLKLFGDYTFIVTLLKLLDYHYTYTRLNSDETIDRMSLLITSILKVEINELLKQYTTMNNQILQYQAPLLYQLQKDLINQWILFLSNPSNKIDDNETSIINKQSVMNQPNFKFILKLFDLFMKLLTNQITKKPMEIDFLVSLLFPEVFINLLFDLFLLSQSHRTKTFILHLFSNLIQTTRHFHLNKHIQYFLFQLFIELPPNPTSKNTRTMKTFQITLMDIVYLLIERQQYQQNEINLTNFVNKQSNIELNITQFSIKFYDLLTTIDIINALVDKSKQISLPIKSTITLEDTFKITLEEMEKSNRYFDIIADQQLISLMNNNSLIDTSMIEFINSLPIESEPNPIYYKIYPSLSHIPSIFIQIRAKLICQFNQFIENLISIIDFNLLPGQSVLIDKIRLARMYILHPIKFQLLNISLTSTEVEPSSGIPRVNFDTVAASNSSHKNSTYTMFNQAYEQLHDNAHVTFRMSNDRLWLAQYIGMHSTDQGGPYRDSITRICSDICSTRLSLFILCPNGRMNQGLNRDRWIPNVFPSHRSISNQIKKQYRFIGQLMGMAIRKKHYLDLKFPNLLWKELVRESISFEDIESIDIQSLTMINEIEQNIKQIRNNNDINDLFSNFMNELRFEVMNSAGQTYELITGGKDIPITANNFKDYCNYYREYRLHEFRRQIEFIRQGLYNIIPGYFLSLFTPNELEEAVCGKGQIDVELLKRNTCYGGEYNVDSPCMQLFWTIMNDMLNEEQKKLFLIFVWGRCTLPSRDEDFTCKFTINSYDVPSNEIDGTLPRSHTCTFAIDLPQYSTIDIMYERLNYAITYCSSIDGDGTMNDMPVPTEFDSDLSANEL